MEDRTSTSKENSGMALSGMIIGIVGLICAFIPAWRSLAIIAGFAGLVVSCYSIYKANQLHAKKTRSVIGIFCGIAAICVGAYFLYLRPAGNETASPEEDAVPAEFHDTSVLEKDHSDALEKLQGLTDSSSTK